MRHLLILVVVLYVTVRCSAEPFGYGEGYVNNINKPNPYEQQKVQSESKTKMVLVGGEVVIVPIEVDIPLWSMSDKEIEDLR